MAPHRMRRRRRKAAPPHLPKGAYRAIAAEGDDLGAAAEVIAGEARRLAAAWSESIPGSVQVEVSGNVATIYTDAPAAYPNEVEGVKHPVYGHPPWVTNKHRPFLGPAGDAKAGDAMDRWAQKYTRMLREAGFK